MNRTARRPGAQQVEGGRRMGRILTVLPPFELLRPGTGRGPAKPRFRGSRCERLVQGILSPLEGGERISGSSLTRRSLWGGLRTSSPLRAICSAAINAELPQRLPHGHDVLGGHVGLDVVDGVEDESAAGSQVVDAPFYLVAHFLRGAVRQHALRVHAPAIEREVLAEVLLELLRIHASGAHLDRKSTRLNSS